MCEIYFWKIREIKNNSLNLLGESKTYNNDKPMPSMPLDEEMEDNETTLKEDNDSQGEDTVLQVSFILFFVSFSFTFNWLFLTLLFT